MQGVELEHWWRGAPEGRTLADVSVWCGAVSKGERRAGGGTGALVEGSPGRKDLVRC